MKTKICLKCKEEKLLSEFTKAKKTCDGYYQYCKKCKYEVDKEYRELKKEKINSRKKVYRKVNQERLSKEAKQYRESPERKKYMQKYLKSYFTSLKESNPEKYNNLKLSIKVLNHQVYAKNKTKNKNSDITKDFLIDLFLNTKTCSLCGVVLSDNGKELNGKQFDHIIPIVNGGMHMRNNIRVICANCNKSKGGK